MLIKKSYDCNFREIEKKRGRAIERKSDREMKRERENKTNLNQKDIEGGFFIIAILGKYKDREREREKWRERE